MKLNNVKKIPKQCFLCNKKTKIESNCVNNYIHNCIPCSITILYIKSKSIFIPSFVTRVFSVDNFFYITQVNIEKDKTYLGIYNKSNMKYTTVGEFEKSMNLFDHDLVLNKIKKYLIYK